MKIEERNGKRVKRDLLKVFRIVSFLFFCFHKVNVDDEVNKRKISFPASPSILSDIESILRLYSLRCDPFLFFVFSCPHFL